MKLADYGERAAYVDLALEGSPDRAERTRAVAAALEAAFPSADVVIGGGAVLVAGERASPALEAIAREALLGGRTPRPGREHRIRAMYDGADLGEVARAVGATPGEIAAEHAARAYVVELVGFLPGFAYLGGLDARLVLPRRATPRPLVPARSIGIAGAFTGIYPFASPGGWNLLGRALGFDPFDPERVPPMLLAPGDVVRFEAVREADARDAADASSEARPRAVPASGRALVVTAAPACATIQDGGRPGRLRHGLPPSGPLDMETHEAANRAVGNEPGAGAIEVPLGPLEVEARGEAIVSVDGEPPVRLASGERLSVGPAARAVRYVAVRGGFDVPVVLGARATMVPARFGGLDGRPLRAGDVVPIGGHAAGAAISRGGAMAAALAEPSTTPLDVDPGPHFDRFPSGALEALVATEWRISRLGDRVGVRLEGGRIPRDRPDLGSPAPMIRGAVQIATDGTPIVLGPDHPTTGGYPVLAVVRRASQPALARLRPGAPVRFRLAPAAR